MKRTKEADDDDAPCLTVTWKKVLDRTTVMEKLEMTPKTAKARRETVFTPTQVEILRDMEPAIAVRTSPRK